MNSNAREVAVVDLVQASVSFRRTVWGAALVAAAVLFAPPLGAQKSTDPTMPLPPGAVREKGLEAAAGGGEGADRRLLRIFRVGAPVEMVFAWYQRQLTPYEDAVQDTAGLQPGETTPISYHLTYHTFVDQCMELAEGASSSSDATAPCKRWRRGLDKQRALTNSRVPLPGGRWMEGFTITWVTRGAGGELVRRQIEVRDTGLSNNWQHDQLRSQITLEREVMERAGQ
jgi:hypothetical protein